MMIDWEQVSECAGCGSTGLEVIWDFKNVPLAGYFPVEGTEILKILFL